MIPRFLIGRDTNPHRNLAREEALLLACERGELDGAALYLWQNANTVVIGRAQNAWRECATEQMRLDGCTLARRATLIADFCLVFLAEARHLVAVNRHYTTISHLRHLLKTLLFVVHIFTF